MTETYAAPIEQIVQSIFSSMLQCDAVRASTPFPPEQENLVASIQIAGEWVGSIVLGLSAPAARSAAAAMLQVPRDEVNDADQRDVAAELVNMIGGNLKSLLPGPSSLSLPTVVAGRDFDLHVHDAALLDDVWFDSDVGRMHVHLYART